MERVVLFLNRCVMVSASVTSSLYGTALVGFGRDEVGRTLWSPRQESSQCPSSLWPFLRSTGEQYKNDLHNPDNHDGVITHLEPDILQCEVKWALESITMNKASGGDGIPLELFQILKDDAVKVLHSRCQQIWKTQQWPQDWKRSVFIPISKKGNAKNVQATAQLHSSHMLAK